MDPLKIQTIVDIVSDCNVRFTCIFWIALFNMIGTRLEFSTANHP